MIVVGGTAMKRICPEWREPADLDVFCGEEGVDGADWHYLPEHIRNLFTVDEDGYADLNSMYTLKLSHLAYDIHWWKHMQDLLHMKKLGAQRDVLLYRALQHWWYEVHGDKSFLNMKKDAASFFNDRVKYVYDHDWLHEVVAYPNPPMYTKCLKDGEEVLIDPSKFDKLKTFDEQVQMFKEEICVIATERWLVHKKGITPQRAYQLALHKTVCNLTKGWACEFILTNLECFLTPLDNWISNLRKHNVDIGEENMKPEWTEEYLSKTKYEYKTAEGGVDSYEVSEEELINILTEGLRWASGISDAVRWLKENGYELLDQDGGGEGGSESCSVVFKLKDKMYRAYYSYYSYEGYDYFGFFDNMKEVKPVQKTITVYE